MQGLMFLCATALLPTTLFAQIYQMSWPDPEFRCHPKSGHSLTANVGISTLSWMPITSPAGAPRRSAIVQW